MFEQFALTLSATFFDIVIVATEFVEQVQYTLAV